MTRIINKILREINKKNVDSIDVEKKYLLFHQHRFEYIFRLLKDLCNKDKYFLDIGSHYLCSLLGAHYLGYKNLYGIDLCVSNLIMQERAKEFNITIKSCDLSREKIPLEDSKFDIALLAETLEHFNFYPQRVVNEALRILKPNGKFIITTPNLLRLNNRIKCLFGKSINDDIKKDYGPGSHYREYSTKEIKYLLKTAGFENIKIRYVDFNYPNRSGLDKIVNKIVGFIFPCLRPNIIAIAIK